MKRLFLISVAVFVVTTGALAQMTYIVGDTSCSITCPSIPVDHAYGFTESQYCIPALELTAAGFVNQTLIQEIGWFLCQEPVFAIDHDIEVYLNMVSDPCPLLCVIPGYDPGIHVYSGPLGNCAPAGCCNVILSTPFLYTPGNCLLVTVCDFNPTSSAPMTRAWAANPDPNNGIFHHNNLNPYDCNLMTDEFMEGVQCCNSWATTCFFAEVMNDTPTPSPTEPIFPTATPTVMTPTPSCPYVPESEPNNTCAEAGTSGNMIMCEDYRCGSVSTFVDPNDIYEFIVPGGLRMQVYISVFADQSNCEWAFGKSLNPHVELYQVDCMTSIAFNEDNGGDCLVPCGNPMGTDAMISVTLDPGNYWIRVGQTGITSGPYVLRTCCTPIFPTITPTVSPEPSPNPTESPTPEPTQEPVCYLGIPDNPLDRLEVIFDDFHGYEYTYGYFFYMDPAQCPICPLGYCINDISFTAYARTGGTPFQFSFFVELYPALEVSPGCYMPDLSTVLCGEGPFLRTVTTDGPQVFTSDPLIDACWCISPPIPMFAGFFWDTPPPPYKLNLVSTTSTSSCVPCWNYLIDPASPGTPVDFCNYGLWSAQTNPYMWATAYCYNEPTPSPTSPANTATPTAAIPSATPTSEIPSVTPTMGSPSPTVIVLIPSSNPAGLGFILIGLGILIAVQSTRTRRKNRT